MVDQAPPPAPLNGSGVANGASNGTYPNGTSTVGLKMVPGNELVQATTAALRSSRDVSADMKAKMQWEIVRRVTPSLSAGRRWQVLVTRDSPSAPTAMPDLALTRL